MRRLVTRLVQRVLMTESVSLVSSEALSHTHGRRRLVVGLGNPGMEGSRHSVGMAVLGALAARLGVADRWHGDKHVSGEVIVSEIQDTQVVLLRPKLLMNINGVSVAKADSWPSEAHGVEPLVITRCCFSCSSAGKYSVKPEDVLLVHDELDKPLGKIAIKHGGSARGHNGVRSCVDCLQTDVMPRLRVGIGRPAGKTPVDRYVLGRFSREEQKVLGAVLDQSVDLLLSQLTDQQAQSPSSPAGGRQAAQKRKERESSASPAKELSLGPS
ncbi:peptidyl-tRNA hydrolase isoform 3-T3 [Polymixia lowei]